MLSLEERYWARVQRTGTNDCWEWAGAHIPGGYASMAVPEIKKTNVGVHRVAFYLTNGYWPNIARHTCDNRGCVNPNHILDGTYQDNAIDMVERKRHFRLAKTTCKNGHPWGDNPLRTPKGTRICRDCKKQWEHEAYLRRRIVKAPWLLKYPEEQNR